MKTRFSCQTDYRQGGAIRFVELLVIIFVVFTGFALLLLHHLARSKDGRPHGIHCVSNLKQVGLAFRVYAGDNNDQYPMSSLTNRDGSLQFADATNEFRYFQIMSNELSTPLVLICPEDKKHHGATNFTTDFSNKHISFFVGLYADDKFPQMFLAGDCNITNGFPLKNGMLNLPTNRVAGWTKERHGGLGNVAFADGSVQQFNTTALRMAVRNAGPKTNLLLMPR